MHEEMARDQNHDWKPPEDASGSKHDPSGGQPAITAACRMCSNLMDSLPSDGDLAMMGLNKADTHFWHTGFNPSLGGCLSNELEDPFATAAWLDPPAVYRTGLRAYVSTASALSCPFATCLSCARSGMS